LIDSELPPQNPFGANRAVEQFAKEDSGVHAVLFYGLPGSGKRRLSMELARAWITGGEERGQPATTFDRGSNPDLLIVTPTGPSRMIKESQLAPPKRGPSDSDFKGVNVLDFIRTPPLISAKKVILIEDADRMASGASNLILKSLEEPEEYFKFILTTTTVGSLPPTILSRCMAVACEVPPNPSSDPLHLVAQGSPGRYEELKPHESVYLGIWQFAETLKVRGAEEALIASETLKDLAEALQKARDLNARTANAEALETLATAFRHLHPDWTVARQCVVEAHRRILGNANATLTFDSLTTEILR